MINIFNRQLLYVGYSQKCKDDIIKVLNENSIRYDLKEWNVRHAQARGRGTFGQLLQYQTTYEIYVARNDFEMGEKLVRHIISAYSSN